MQAKTFVSRHPVIGSSFQGSIDLFNAVFEKSKEKATYSEVAKVMITFIITI